MAESATAVETVPSGASLLDRKMKKSPAWVSTIVVLAALIGGLVYIGYHVAGDLGNVAITSVWPYLLLALARPSAGVIAGIARSACAVRTARNGHSGFLTRKLVISMKERPGPGRIRFIHSSTLAGSGFFARAAVANACGQSARSAAAKAC